MKIELWICEACGWAGTVPAKEARGIVRDGETADVHRNAVGETIAMEVYTCPKCGVTLRK